MPYIDTKYLGQCETCRHHSNSGCNTYCDHGEEYSPNLSKIPTADVVEVKRGKWEKRTFIVFDNEIKDSYHCSECNTTWDTATNYCPNCGAKMDGGKKE